MTMSTPLNARTASNAGLDRRLTAIGIAAGLGLLPDLVARKT